MKYYLIAGEASGDLHGSNLVKKLKLRDPDADIRAWGGDLMEQAGAAIIKHYRDLAFMGFVEVVANIRTILKNMRFCKKDIQNFAPDVLVLIDYPGFNIPIAEWAKQKGIRVVYYISPQVWAWKENRVKRLKKSVDRMLVILPFEKAFFEKWHWDVTYVGHPLVEVIEDFRQHHPELKPQPNLIALLPGSRKQEIMKKLPVMLEATRYLEGYRFVVAKAPGVDPAFYDSMLNNRDDVAIADNQTYALLCTAAGAMVTSGTATLETALFGVPQVICYKGNPVSYQIARRLVKIKFIGLVNLIMNRELVKELIQHELTAENIARHLKPLLTDTPERRKLKEAYSELFNTLRAGGNASDNAAEAIMQLLKKPS